MQFEKPQTIWSMVTIPPLCAKPRADESDLTLTTNLYNPQQTFTPLKLLLSFMIAGKQTAGCVKLCTCRALDTFGKTRGVKNVGEFL